VPLYWVIDSRSQLVTVKAEGQLTLAELDQCVAAIGGAHAVPYAKIFDGTECDASSIGKEDMLQLAVSIRSLHVEPTGPLAIVMPLEKRERLMPILGVLAAAKRPLRLFTSRKMAEKWINRLNRPPSR
jgi:hypothetical protein